MKISVIIPVYNAEKHIDKCLNSVINQTYSNWEVIAIDDGSDDDSYKILLKYANIDNRFKVKSHNNQGPGRTRNKALDFISGDYIVFIDSDDYVENDYFENIVENVKLFYSDVIFIDVAQETPDGKFIKNECASKYMNSNKDTIIRHQMTGKLPWGGCRKVVKSSLVIDNNIKYSDDDVGEEALFSLLLLLSSKNISFIDKICYHYVIHPYSQSSKGADDPWGDICKRIKKYLVETELYNKYETTINSFAYAALIVSIYRISQNYNFSKSIFKIKRAINNFIYNYSLDLDKDSLETRTYVLIPLIKYKMIYSLYIISKIKKTLSR